MQNEILEILMKTLPNGFIYNVQKGKNCFNGEYLKIWAAASNINVNNVEGQKVQLVSLCLDLDKLDLYPQYFGGNGGQRIYREPNKDDPKERFLAMKSVKIPFRKPKADQKNILAAVERFFSNYILALKENKEKLMYQNLVNYNEILN